VCGIVGISQSTEEIDLPVLKQMVKTIRHRGPDDTGCKLLNSHKVGLGHCRLSIIDLSANGHQPMQNENGTLWVTYNGEIYNFSDIRKKLVALGHVFHSETDTEVILHAYEEWGFSCFQNFRGMFAFGLWDEKSKELILARDRLGIKPLFYYHDNEKLIFASELKAILAHTDIDLSIDQTAIFDFLSFGNFIPAPKTPYRNIKKLLPGHYLKYKDGKVEIQSYWQLNFHPMEIDQAEAIHNFLDLLDETIKLHLVSDVPLGVLLSGGLDSSTIVAETTRLSNTNVKTFSMGFDVVQHCELDRARLVAHHFQTDHNERVMRSPEAFNLLDSIVDLYDEPFAASSALPTYLISQLAASQVKVVLSGDGGDEAFAGYKWYDRWLSGSKRSAIPLYHSFLKFVTALVSPGATALKLASYSNACSLQQIALLRGGFHQILQKALLAPKLAHQLDSYDDMWYLRRYWRPELPLISRLQYLDLHTYLPDKMLTKVDRASMAVSIEIRVPFVDHRLLEFVARVPHMLLYGNGGKDKKWLVKQAMKGILPHAIIHGAKKGFSVPLEYWFHESSINHSVNHFTGAGIDCGILAPDFREKIRKWGIRGHHLWSLLVLDRWLAKNGNSIIA
jgi:asparagine synthase (glutamine-hydrolysing)